MRIGIMGGTFDPVHRGHLRNARMAARALALDRVLLVPAGVPWHRRREPVCSAVQRWTMAGIAAASTTLCRASRVDVDRPGPTFTVDTVRAVRARYGPGAELTLIVGTDTFRTMPGWFGLEELLSEVDVAVCRRGEPGAIPSLFAPHRVHVVPGANSTISATECRRRLALGIPAHDLLPAAVHSYITAHGLYTPRTVLTAR